LRKGVILTVLTLRNSLSPRRAGREVKIMKKILLSLLTIALVSVVAVGATRAYFADDEIVPGNTFSTGTVRIGETWQMPLTFSGLYPAAEQTSPIFAVKYIGSVKGDLYYGLKFTPNHDDLSGVLYIQIERVTSAGDHIDWIYGGWTSVTQPFNNWTKVASGLNQNEWAYYKLSVRMDQNAGNEYQDKTAVNDVVLYAVQQGGPTPSGVIPYNYSGL
jgi:predicted ribosomally synthesized peptide with SipW-like signal peptide